MADLKRITKILKHIENLDDTRFLNGIRIDLVERLTDRKTHLEFIKDKQECPVCRGKGGHLESYNDCMGRRDEVEDDLIYKLRTDIQFAIDEAIEKFRDKNSSKVPEKDLEQIIKDIRREFN